MANYIKEYNEQIEAGIEIVSKKVQVVYKRLAKTTDAPEDSKYYFNEKEATRPITFIESFCKQSQGVIGETLELMLWQKALIQTIFGFLSRSTQQRQYREAFVLVARKNGKSTLLSAISLFMLVADKEGASEVYSIATKLDQSKRIITEAWNMVKQSPDLKSIIKKRRNDMYFPNTSSIMQAQASTSKSLDGLNTHLGVVDEAHAIRDRSLYEVIKQSMQSRRQPLLFVITTAGTVRENIYDSLYDYASKIAIGELEDETFLPILYELDDIEEWTDEKQWYKANPGLGKIKFLEALRDEVERAKRDPDYQTGVLCKHFNLRQASDNLWLTFDDFNTELCYNEDDINHKYCIGGADLSSTTDLSSATLLTETKLKVFKNDEEQLIKKVLIKQMYWMPQERYEERMREDKVPYDKWVEKGYLRLCEGNKVNYKDITKWFVDEVNDNGLRPLWVGYDSWNAQYWCDEMQAYGFDMVEVRQGAKTMSSPMKQMKGDLQDKTIVYNNNPILKWCFSNLSIKADDNDNIRPVKGKAGTRQRIDGAVSLIDCYVIYTNKYQEFKNRIGE